jgi:hypothetical protein
MEIVLFALGKGKNDTILCCGAYCCNLYIYIYIYGPCFRVGARRDLGPGLTLAARRDLGPGPGRATSQRMNG